MARTVLGSGARRTARPRLVDSVSVSNHSSDRGLSTYLWLVPASAGRREGGGRRHGSGLAAHLCNGAPGRFLHPRRRSARTVPAGCHLADPYAGATAGTPAVPPAGPWSDSDDHGDELAQKAARTSMPWWRSPRPVSTTSRPCAPCTRRPAEFTSERALPALTALTGEDGRGSRCAPPSEMPRKLWRGWPPDIMIWPSVRHVRAAACSRRLRSATRSTSWSPLRGGSNCSAPGNPAAEEHERWRTFWRSRGRTRWRASPWWVHGVTAFCLPLLGLRLRLPPRCPGERDRPGPACGSGVRGRGRRARGAASLSVRGRSATR
ncbi:hypothetical protein SALBM311S_07459 [Streptomyces alboniger]